MLKLVVIICALYLETLGTSDPESWHGQQVIDSVTFTLRLHNEYYDIKQKQEKFVKNIKECAQFCKSQLECVAFNCGPTTLGYQGRSKFCSLIFVKDLNSLSRVEIKTLQGAYYYEMDCHQFCDLHNAELKLLACAPLNLGITLLSLPKCKCESIKPNCGVLG